MPPIFNLEIIKTLLRDVCHDCHRMEGGESESDWEGWAYKKQQWNGTAISFQMKELWDDSVPLANRDSSFEESRVSENWWQKGRFWNYLVMKLPSNNSTNHENRLFWCLFSKTRFGETSRKKFHVVCAVLLDTPKPPQFQPLLLRWWP